MLWNLVCVGASIMAAACVCAFLCMAVGPYIPDWMDTWPSLTLLGLSVLLILVPAAVFWHTWSFMDNLL